MEAAVANTFNPNDDSSVQVISIFFLIDSITHSYAHPDGEHHVETVILHIMNEVQNVALNSTIVSKLCLLVELMKPPASNLMTPLASLALKLCLFKKQMNPSTMPLMMLMVNPTSM